MLFCLLLVLLMSIAGTPAAASAQRAEDSAAALNDTAIRAYRAKDYTQFTALERRALTLDPENPRYLYDAACGEALLGHARVAVALLDSLLARKIDLGAAVDSDFAGIRGTPEWVAFASRLKTLDEPIVRSTVAFTIDDPELDATGLTVDPQTGDVYVASVRERKIVRRRHGGAVADFVPSGQDGFLAGASLAIDTTRQILYATTSAAPFMRGYAAADAGRSGIFAFDLHSGKTIRRVMLPADGKQHFLNALVVDRRGNVYISDSGLSGIYLLRPSRDTLEVFIPSTTFRATQGLALSADERSLYVADYTDGVWSVSMDARTRRQLSAPPGVWLGGLDGLARGANGLIAVQIGVQPNRVLRLRLDGDNTRIMSVDILEMAHPAYDGPIQGTATRSEFWYVADSQLRLGNPATGAFDTVGARPTVVLELPIQ